jgi:hypothetical protein
MIRCEFPETAKTTRFLDKNHELGVRMNRLTIAGMKPNEMLSRTLPSILRFSITGKGNRPDSGSRLLPLLNDGSMKNDWWHEIFGLHD